jgi:hypothetical protein
MAVAVLGAAGSVVMITPLGPAAGAWHGTAVAGDGTVGMSWWHSRDRVVNADIVARGTISHEIRTL